MSQQDEDRMTARQPEVEEAVRALAEDYLATLEGRLEAWFVKTWGGSVYTEGRVGWSGEFVSAATRSNLGEWSASESPEGLRIFLAWTGKTTTVPDYEETVEEEALRLVGGEA